MEYSLEKLHNSQIIIDPWEHIFIENFLPEDFYKNLVNMLNGLKSKDFFTSLQEKIPSSGPASFRLPVYDSNIDCIKDYFTMFDSDEFKKSIISKFDICKRKIAGDFTRIGSIQEGYYDVSTYGHKYRVHRDSKYKLVTIVFHLAEPGDDVTLGTRMYPPTKDVESLDWEKDCVKITEYKPNSLLIFPSNKHTNKCTNHAMGHTSKITTFRKNLITFYPLLVK